MRGMRAASEAQQSSVAAAASRTGADCRRAGPRFRGRRRRRRSSPARAHRPGTDRRGSRGRRSRSGSRSCAPSRPRRRLGRPATRRDRAPRGCPAGTRCARARSRSAARRGSSGSRSRQRQSSRLNGSCRCTTSGQASAASASIGDCTETPSVRTVPSSSRSISRSQIAPSNADMWLARCSSRQSSRSRRSETSDCSMLSSTARAHFVMRCVRREFAQGAELGDGAHGLLAGERLAETLLAVAIGARGVEFLDAGTRRLAHEPQRRRARGFARAVGRAIGETKLHRSQHQLRRASIAHAHRPSFDP